jgi:hypothetical protein
MSAQSLVDAFTLHETEDHEAMELLRLVVNVEPPEMVILEGCDK